MSSPFTRIVGDPGNDHRAASSSVATRISSTSAAGAVFRATSSTRWSARFPWLQPGLISTWIFNGTDATGGLIASPHRPIARPPTLATPPPRPIMMKYSQPYASIPMTR
jgi:hypothetical protein